MDAQIDPPYDDVVRLRARVDREVLEKARDGLVSQTANLAAWLIASSLAINGAGILAVVNVIDKRQLWISEILFSVGILLSLFCGFLSQRSAVDAIGPINDTICLKSLVENQPNLLDFANSRLDNHNLSLERRARPKRLCLLGSVISFLAGAITFGMAPDKRDIDNERRCGNIQVLMLSPRPTRTDWPAVFQALGCRPQGKGSVYASPVAKVIDSHN